MVQQCPARRVAGELKLTLSIARSDAMPTIFTVGWVLISEATEYRCWQCNLRRIHPSRRMDAHRLRAFNGRLFDPCVISLTA